MEAGVKKIANFNQYFFISKTVQDTTVGSLLSMAVL